MTIYTYELFLVMPRALQSVSNVAESLRDVVKLAGGCSSSWLAGEWLDSHGNTHFDQNVRFSWLATDDNKRDIEAAIEEVANEMRLAGELAVLRGATPLTAVIN